MDNLPLVPVMKIIDYLSIEDVLNLKLVNKWFYQFINKNVRIKDLVMTTHDLSPNRRLFYTYDLINLQNLVRYDLDDNVYPNLNQPILGQLKQLYISDTTINLETLNSLDRLVHLEIIVSKIESITENNVLNLPMLEILNLAQCFYMDLLIDSTKLQKLKFYARSNINNYVDLAYAESITYLEVNGYFQCKNFLPSCINLEHFYCHDLDLDHLNEFDLVKNLSKLKSIHFDKPRDAFASLVKEKRLFNKDLKIYFLNLEFDELPDGLNDICRLVTNDLGDYLGRDLIPYYAEHYSKLADHCPFVDTVDYNELEWCFDQIPVNFMKGFVNLKGIYARNDVNNLDQLIRVLGECKTITRLVLPSSLGQHFFDFHLYDLCPNIYSLDILGGKALNCEFILKFKYICTLYFSRTESIEFVRRLVESREYIFLDFNYFHNQDLIKIEISKFGNVKYSIQASKRSDKFVFNSLDDLYKWESNLDKN